MLVGHYSGGFVAKRLEPGLPLWLLFVAAQLVDIAWDVLVLLGVEKMRIVPGITAANPLDLYYMPYTHSLVAAVLWSAAAYVVCRSTGLAVTPKGAVLVALVVGSHWVEDLIAHRPDLPLYDDRMKVGFGLWNAPLLESALEIALVVAPIALIVRAHALSERERRRLVTLGAVLCAIQVIATFGPLPTSATAVAISALTIYSAMAVLAARVDAAAGG